MLEEKLQALENKLNEQVESKSKRNDEFREKEERYMQIINNFTNLHQQNTQIKDSHRTTSSIEHQTEENA